MSIDESSRSGTGVNEMTRRALGRRRRRTRARTGNPVRIAELREGSSSKRAQILEGKDDSVTESFDFGNFPAVNGSMVKHSNFEPTAHEAT